MSGYSEEIYYSLSSIADSLKRPDEGCCLPLYDEDVDGTKYIVAEVALPKCHFSYERGKIRFYVLFSKKYDLDAFVVVLVAGNRSDAIRTGIAMIDQAKQSRSDDDQAKQSRSDDDQANQPVAGTAEDIPF